MKNRKSHAIVEMGLQILLNLDHRGAVGADPKLGDGCGMLIQIPHRFFAEECAKLGFALPEPGHYAVGQFFMPRDAEARAARRGDRRRARSPTKGAIVLGWRDVPVDNSATSASASSAVEPVASPGLHRPRRRPSPTRTTSSAGCSSCARSISNRDLRARRRRDRRVSIRCRCRRRTIVYKGMVLVRQLGALLSATCTTRASRSALALVHQRFSTNTFPSWQLAHPYRMVAHNGEINTLRGNVNWMAARQAIGRPRRCSATTSPSCGRSPTRASPTPPASTTRSNSWCAAAIRSPTR